MKKMHVWKRTLAGLLALALVAGYSAPMDGPVGGLFGRPEITAQAATDLTTLYVGGEQVTVGQAASGEHWSYAPATDMTPATLTLDNYTYSGPGSEGAGIYAVGDLIINVTGNCSVSKDNSTTEDYYGIYVDGALTITGDGTLELSTAENSVNSRSYALYCGDLVIDNTAIVKATGKNAYISNGILCCGNLTVEEKAELTATSGSAASDSYGIYCYGAISINGTLTANGGTSSNESSYGIRCFNRLTVNGTLIATGDTSSNKYSYGIWCRDDLTVNGTVEADGGNAEIGSYGIRCGNDLTVNGAMNATGGDGNDRFGCYLVSNAKMIPGAGIIAEESDDGTTWSAAGVKPEKPYVRAYSMNVTAPKVIDDLTYNGEAQPLITAGALEDGVAVGTKLEYGIKTKNTVYTPETDNITLNNISELHVGDVIYHPTGNG